MKARFVFACAAAGIALTAFGTATASAEESTGYLGFSTDWAIPGDMVEITGNCSDPNFTSATIKSDVLEVTEPIVTPDGIGGFDLRATATVKAGATPEWWPASFLCGGTTVTGYLRVAEPKPLPRAEITVDPKKGAPGAKVNITVLCSAGVTITSPALEISQLGPLNDSTPEYPLHGATGVVKDVKPGNYEVATDCGGAEITTKFTVTGSAPVPAKKNAQVPVKPKGAADTGSLDRPATRTAAPAEGSDSGLFVLGGSALAALGAAGGVGAWAYRRRQRA